MKVQFKPLPEQVIVITGASSGIGLATALAAAKKGAKLVLAARNAEALEKIASDIVAGGGDAVPVAADVGRQEDVNRISRTAIAAFGGFDTWVNDAGTGIFGKLEDVSHEDSRRLFDTNFWGVVHGSLAALQHLKAKGGALINIGSVASDHPAQDLGMYSASKHAVKGFTEALRMEAEADGYPVSVTLVKPAAIGTPFFEHAKNYTEGPQDAPSPVYAPEEVANAILYAATHRVPVFNVGGAGHMASALAAFAPGITSWLGKSRTKNEKPASAPRNDNLHAPANDGRVHGEDGGKGQISLYSRSRLHPVMTGLTLTALAGAAAAIASSEKTRRRLRKMF